MKHRGFNRDAFGTLVVQSLGVAGFAVLVASLRGVTAAGSCLSGGLICILPSILLYRSVFSHFGARQAKTIVKAFYLGEALKFVFTGIGFLAAFQIVWIQPLWLFLGFLGAQTAFWLSPILIGLRRKQRMKA